MSWGRYGGRPLFVLCLVGLVDAIDRGVLPAVIEGVQKSLHFSDFEAGLLYTALIVAAVLVAVPGGSISDRGDRRKVITGVLVLWSAMCALAGIVQSFWQLLIVRAGLGVGDALNDPAAQSLVADYYRSVNDTVKGKVEIGVANTVTNTVPAAANGAFLPVHCTL